MSVIAAVRKLLKIGLVVGVITVGTALGIALYQGSQADTPRPVEQSGPPETPVPTAQPIERTASPVPPTTTDVHSTLSGVQTTQATPVPSARPKGANPWEQETLVVAIRNNAAPQRALEGPIRDAVAYWDLAADTYAAYTVKFTVIPDAEDPDIIVWYNHTIDCPNHADAVGCAPLLNSSITPQRPEHVQIRFDPADNRRQVRNTVIHEFGHILGVGHCDEPRWIMGPSCRSPVPDAPNVDERMLAWRSTGLSIYVDTSSVATDKVAATNDQADHALKYFESGADGTVPDAVSFSRVDERWEADIVVRFVDEAGCGPEAVVCIAGTGRDVDNDGALEYYTLGEITIERVDSGARGWYVGWGLARLLTPDGVPAILADDVSYETRRSAWWE